MPSRTVPAPLRVRRLPERAAYDEATIAPILDEALVCHVAVVREGRPVVIPTLHARDGDRLLLHGSKAAGLFRDLRRDDTVCVTVTLIDGLVLARSAFHHSVNYRSVVVHGRAEEITDPEQKTAALRVVVEHVARGRWDDVRPPTAAELRETGVWAVPLTDASAKVRTGGPKDEAEDLVLPVWAGVLPLRLTSGEPLSDGGDAALPAYVAGWRDQPAASPA